MCPPVWLVFLPPPSWSWTYLGPEQSPSGPVSQLQTPGRTPACMPAGRGMYCNAHIGQHANKNTNKKVAKTALDIFPNYKILIL